MRQIVSDLITIAREVPGFYVQKLKNLDAWAKEVNAQPKSEIEWIVAIPLLLIMVAYMGLLFFVANHFFP